jgi:hypothetical protein
MALKAPFRFARDVAIGNKEMGTSGVIPNMWNNVTGPGPGYSPFRGEGTITTPWANAMTAMKQRMYNSPLASDAAARINRVNENPTKATMMDRVTNWGANLSNKIVSKLPGGWGAENNEALEQMNADARGKTLAPKYTPKTY